MRMVHPFRYDGLSMIALHPERVERDFEAGRVYLLGVYDERSPESHRHYFACIRVAFENLREADAARFPTPNYLRKWALCKAGYCEVREHVAQSAQEAKSIFEMFVTRWHALMSNIWEGGDEEGAFVVQRAGRVIRVHIPHSQSMQAMGKERFEKSKRDVLDVLATLIGVDPTQLSKAGDEHVQ